VVVEPAQAPAVHVLVAQVHGGLHCPFAPHVWTLVALEHCCVPGVQAPALLDEAEELEELEVEELELLALDEPPPDELLSLEPAPSGPESELLLAPDSLLPEPELPMLEPESLTGSRLEAFDPELPLPLSGESVPGLSPSTASHPARPTAITAHPCRRFTALGGCYAATRARGNLEDTARRPASSRWRFNRTRP